MGAVKEEWRQEQEEIDEAMQALGPVQGDYPDEEELACFADIIPALMNEFRKIGFVD